MTTETTIPANIMAIMEEKKAQVRAEQAAEAEANKRKQDELFAMGSQMYIDFRAAAIEKLPEWIREYVEPSSLGIEDFIQFGRGCRIEPYLFIAVPGLARIMFNAEKQTFMESTAWWRGYVESEPELRFDRDSGVRKDLEYTLCRAEKEMHDHQENLIKWKAAKERELQEYNRSEAADQEADERRKELARARAEQEARDAREELYTFDILKNDAIAMHLVKAFLLLQDERSGFANRLQDMDETMYSLQDDLDDAEKKLKKAERAARGW